MATMSASFLIYSSCMPLVKTYLSILCGYLLARFELFPPAAIRGASQVTVNVSLPALIFSNIVPAFTPENVSAIGPLFLTAFTYQLIGFVFGIIIREICYVPRNFWQGIVVISGMNNWANLPNAVVLSVTQQPPFDPLKDPALGVSFVSIFIVSYHIIFWMGGVARSLSWDYLPGVPQGEEAERHVSWKEKPIGSRIVKCFGLDSDTTIQEDSNVNLRVIKGKTRQDIDWKIPIPASSSKQPDVELGEIEVVQRRSSGSQVSHRPTSDVLSQSPTQRLPPTNKTNGSHPSIPAEPKSRLSGLWTILRPVLHFIRPISLLITPVTLSLVISLPIALVQPLKALFVDTSGTGSPKWKAPDGRPPLAFVIDTATLLGNIAIPLALIVLGAQFSRLRFPRPFTRLPLKAMLSVACAKLVLLPVIGVVMVQGMVKKGMIHEHAKVERFVAMFLSGTPAAVNQLIVASLYAPDGNVDIHSAFFLVQYIFMFFTSSALTAVALLLL